MNWFRKLFGVKTNFEIMLEHLEASRDRDRELLRMSMGTIDRVVAARYDRPTLESAPPLPAPETHIEDLVDVNVDDETWLRQ